MAKGFSSFGDALKGLPREAEKQVKEKKSVDGAVAANVSSIESAKNASEQADDELFKRLTTFFKLEAGEKKNERRCAGIRRLIADSHTQDVSHDVQRWLGQAFQVESGDMMGERVYDDVQSILHRGYAAESAKWLRSLAGEGMKYGRRPGDVESEVKKYRLDMANKYASEAGKTIEDIAQEANINLSDS